jgi:hypothetical protein
MRNFVTSSIALLMLSATHSVHAAPIDAVSYLQMDYEFSVLSNSGYGASPEGITSRVSAPDFSASINSQIDDPSAVTAIDQNNVQIGCASCEPAIPFTSERRLRTNRTDPTEFADAQWNVENTIVQDQGADVTALAIGSEETDRNGLAQLRVTSSPAAAQADSSYGISRVTTFENTTDESLNFFLVGELGGDLLSRYSGDDGFARASSTQSILFSGVTDDNLSLFQFDSDTSNVTETGAGASVTSGVFGQDDGIMGLLFTASATAVGDGGFTEAMFSMWHWFIFSLTLEPGQIVEMETAFFQSNYVEYTPSDVSQVPLPASFVFLISGVALLVGRKAIAKRNA